MSHKVVRGRTRLLLSLGCIYLISLFVADTTAQQANDLDALLNRAQNWQTLQYQYHRAVPQATANLAESVGQSTELPPQNRPSTREVEMDMKTGAEPITTGDEALRLPPQNRPSAKEVELDRETGAMPITTGDEGTTLPPQNKPSSTEAELDRETGALPVTTGNEALKLPPQNKPSAAEVAMDKETGAVPVTTGDEAFKLPAQNKPSAAEEEMDKETGASAPTSYDGDEMPPQYKPDTTELRGDQEAGAFKPYGDDGVPGEPTKAVPVGDVGAQSVSQKKSLPQVDIEPSQSGGVTLKEIATKTKKPRKVSPYYASSDADPFVSSGGVPSDTNKKLVDGSAEQTATPTSTHDAAEDGGTVYYSDNGVPSKEGVHLPKKHTPPAHSHNADIPSSAVHEANAPKWSGLNSMHGVAHPSAHGVPHDDAPKSRAKGGHKSHGESTLPHPDATGFSTGANGVTAAATLVEDTAAKATEGPKESPRAPKNGGTAVKGEGSANAGKTDEAESRGTPPTAKEVKKAQDHKKGHGRRVKSPSKMGEKDKVIGGPKKSLPPKSHHPVVVQPPPQKPVVAEHVKKGEEEVHQHVAPKVVKGAAAKGPTEGKDKGSSTQDSAPSVIGAAAGGAMGGVVGQENKEISLYGDSESYATDYAADPPVAPQVQGDLDADELPDATPADGEADGQVDTPAPVNSPVSISASMNEAQGSSGVLEQNALPSADIFGTASQEGDDEVSRAAALGTVARLGPDEQELTGLGRVDGEQHAGAAVAEKVHAADTAVNEHSAPNLSQVHVAHRNPALFRNQAVQPRTHAPLPVAQPPASNHLATVETPHRKQVKPVTLHHGVSSSHGKPVNHEADFGDYKGVTNAPTKAEMAALNEASVKVKKGISSAEKERENEELLDHFDITVRGNRPTLKVQAALDEAARRSLQEKLLMEMDETRPLAKTQKGLETQLHQTQKELAQVNALRNELGDHNGIGTTDLSETVVGSNANSNDGYVSVDSYPTEAPADGEVRVTKAVLRGSSMPTEAPDSYVAVPSKSQIPETAYKAAHLDVYGGVSPQVDPSHVVDKVSSHASMPAPANEANTELDEENGQSSAQNQQTQQQAQGQAAAIGSASHESTVAPAPSASAEMTESVVNRVRDDLEEGRWARPLESIPVLMED